MLAEVILLLIAAGAVLAATLVGPRKIEPKRDALFLAFVVQAIIYAFIAPGIDLIGAPPETVYDYVRLQALALLLFLIPMVLAYRVLVARLPSATLLKPSISDRRMALFLAFLVVFEIAFFFVTLRSDMLFRRIGSEGIAERQAALDSLSLLIIRTHDLLALPLMAYLWFIQVRVGAQPGVNRSARLLLFVALVIETVSYTIVAVFNSRGVILIADVVLFGTYLLYTRRSLLSSLVRVGLPIAILSGYLVMLVPNVRVLQAAGGQAIGVLDPTYALQHPVTPSPAPGVSASPEPNASAVVSREASRMFRVEFVNRVDCMDLLQRMQPSLDASGYELGRAWKVPALIAFTQFFDRGLTQQYKASAQTSAKSYLIAQHTELHLSDYYSCSLTDLYADFGPWGYPFGGMLLAALFVLALALLRGNTPIPSSIATITGFFLLVHLITFEQEYVMFLVGWIRYLPGLVALLIINPVRFQRESTTGASSSERPLVGRALRRGTDPS